MMLPVRVLVDAYYTIDGRPYVDAYDPETGAFYPRCPAAGLGGGDGTLEVVPPSEPGEGDEEFAMDPDTTQAAQVVLLPVSGSRGHYWIATPMTIHPGGLGLDDETPETKEDEDHKGKAGLRDRVIRYGGSTIILDARGNVTISPGAMLRGQLGGGAVFRLSRDGEAGERLVLGGPLLDYLGALESYVDTLEARVATLEAWATSAQAVMAAKVDVPPGTAPTTTATFTASTAGSRPTAGDGLKAAAIHVSSDDEG